MSVQARKVTGALLLLAFAGASFGFAMLARTLYRAKTGVDEAEYALAKIGERAAATFAARGTLCGSSALTSSNPFIQLEYEFAREPVRDALDAEIAANTGFHCLGIRPRDLGAGQDMFSYESHGREFVARAFRSYLYDPQGELPRWELRGEVVDGKLELDSIRRIAPGGPSFLGHPSTSSSYY